MIASFESKLSIFKLKQKQTFELNYPAIEQNCQAFSKVCKKTWLKQPYVSEQTRCDYTKPLNDQYLIYTDKASSAFSDAQCELACTSETEFNCRSYTFRSQSRPGTPQCLLSGDNTESAGKNAFQIESGAIFAEKQCFDDDSPRAPIARPQVCCKNWFFQ